MNRQSKVIVLLMAASVVALYVETILQIYICVTTQETSLPETPAAIVALTMIFISFLLSSVTSAFNAHTTMSFDDDRQWTSKNVCRCLHAIYLGLLWRIGKLLVSSSKSEMKFLTAIRLIHVALQSCPFVVIYSSIFISAGKINVIQVLSVVSSVISTVLAITCYNLRIKICSIPVLEGDIDSQKLCGCERKYVAIILAFIGTFLIITIRLISISLMAFQEPHWIFLPLGCHFFILLVIFIGFSSRSKAKTKALPKDMFMHCMWGVGMSILNCFELVHDKVESLMCKYVGFFSLFLLENIVFLSFWLLRFEMDYVSKLMSIVGILVGFIVGLVAKFAGCNVLNQKRQSTVESPSPGTVLTITNASSGMSHNLSFNVGDDDLVSIVQASVYKQPRQSYSPGPKELSSRKKKKHKTGKYSTDQCNQGNIDEEINQQIHAISKEHSRNIPLSIISQANILSGEKFRKESDNKSSDLDNSFQPDSMFNVSDPGTIRSDMMYDKGCEENGFETLNATSLRQSRHSNNYQDLQPDFPKNRHVHHNRYLHTQTTAFEPWDMRKNRNYKKSNVPVDDQNVNHSKIDRTQKSGASFESLQPNEFSDAALSSAKTFPMESKKSDYKTQDASFLSKSNLGRKMNKIIVSLEEHEQSDPSKSRFDHVARNGPNSDDDIIRYKLSNAAFLTARNRISYTEPEDISSSENVTYAHGTVAKNRLSDRKNKAAKLPKHDSHRTATSSSTPAIVLTPSTLRLCESESSTFSSLTMENHAYTKTSSSSSSCSQSVIAPYWDITGRQSGKKMFLPEDDNQLTSSENILRWLACTEDTEHEARV